MTNQNNNGSRVSWVVFIAIVTLFITAIGWVFSVSNGATVKADVAIKEVSEVKGDIKSINTSIANISEQLRNINIPQLNATIQSIDGRTSRIERKLDL